MSLSDLAKLTNQETNDEEPLFRLFTECPTFNLYTGSEDKTKTSFQEWEPPCSLDDVREAIEELNSDSPVSIMLETQNHSLSVMGGPQRFMCVMSDGLHFYHFVSRNRKKEPEPDFEIRIGGHFQTKPGQYVLSKEQALDLAFNFARGHEMNSSGLFDIETIGMNGDGDIT